MGTDLRDAARQAMEALEDHAKQYPHMQKGYTVDAITALRAALEQPEQCSCGDRSKEDCPGEWEPGCDLGNNPKYARRAEDK